MKLDYAKVWSMSELILAELCVRSLGGKFGSSIFVTFEVRAGHGPLALIEAWLRSESGLIGFQEAEPAAFRESSIRIFYCDHDGKFLRRPRNVHIHCCSSRGSIMR